MTPLPESRRLLDALKSGESAALTTLLSHARRHGLTSVINLLEPPACELGLTPPSRPTDTSLNVWLVGASTELVDHLADAPDIPAWARERTGPRITNLVRYFSSTQGQHTLIGVSDPTHVMESLLENRPLGSPLAVLLPGVAPRIKDLIEHLGLPTLRVPNPVTRDTLSAEIDAFLERGLAPQPPFRMWIEDSIEMAPGRHTRTALCGVVRQGTLHVDSAVVLQGHALHSAPMRVWDIQSFNRTVETVSAGDPVAIMVMAEGDRLYRGSWVLTPQWLPVARSFDAMVLWRGKPILEELRFSVRTRGVLWGVGGTLTWIEDVSGGRDRVYLVRIELEAACPLFAGLELELWIHEEGDSRPRPRGLAQVVRPELSLESASRLVDDLELRPPP